MSRRLRSGALFVSCLVGCGAAPAARPAAPPDGVTLAKGPDSGQVDKVGAKDGALGPDGVNDLSFVAEVDGPVAAVFLATVDDAGSTNGEYQADTLVDFAEVPKEISTRWGKTTGGLGVFESDHLLNRPDGSIATLGGGHHRLAIYVSPAHPLPPGARLRVWIQRPDGGVVTGATLTQ